MRYEDAPKTHKRSLQPILGADRRGRRRLGLRHELLLVVLPTATVLLVLAFVEHLSEQRLLFSSLASSALLIYLDPNHGTNSVRTLMIAQIGCALIGWFTFALIGSTYWSAGTAIIVAIALMMVTDALHPPAVATALSFAFRAGDADNLLLFGMAVLITALLIVIERATVWLLARHAS